MEERRTIEETLRSLNQRWMKSYTEHDAEFLETHMAESYVGTYPDGSVHNKKSEIEAVKSGNIAIVEMYPIEMDVQIHNLTAAVLTGTSSVEARVEGKVVNGRLRFTDVWVKTGENWQAVASHVTQISQSD